MKIKQLVEAAYRNIVGKAHNYIVCDPKEEKTTSLSGSVKASFPFTTMEDNVLFYNPFTEKYVPGNPAICGKPGRGRQYSLKEIHEKMKAEGIESFVVLDEKKLQKYSEICDSLRGEFVDMPPRTVIEFYDPAKNPVVQRCWKCPNSEVIVYPPGQIDILCRLHQGMQFPMVARIYSNGSLKTTTLIHGKSISETIKWLHLFHDPNGLMPTDIKPFPEECPQRTKMRAGIENSSET